MSVDAEAPTTDASVVRRPSRWRWIVLVVVVALLAAGLTFRQAMRAERQVSYEQLLQATITATTDELTRQSALPAAERSIEGLSAVVARTLVNDRNRNVGSQLQGGSVGATSMVAQIEVHDYSLDPWWLGSTGNYDVLVLWLPNGDSSQGIRACSMRHGDPFGGVPTSSVQYLPTVSPGTSAMPCTSDNWSDAARAL